MKSVFRWTGAAQIVLASSVLILASCSSDGGGSGGNGFIPAEDDSNVVSPPATQPPVTQPPVTQPPVTQPPVTEPPVTQPPVVEPPVAPPPTPEVDAGDDLSSLYGTVTFVFQFDGSEDVFGYETVFSEADRTTGEDGSSRLERADAGNFDRFACFDPVQGQFFCIGFFTSGVATLFGFDLTDGVGSGVVEVCTQEELAAEGGAAACADDFVRTPDGSLAVVVTPSVQASTLTGNDVIRSGNAFEPMLVVNDQATRFGVFHTPPTTEQSAQIAQRAEQIKQLEKSID